MNLAEKYIPTIDTLLFLNWPCVSDYFPTLSGSKFLGLSKSLSLSLSSSTVLEFYFLCFMEYHFTYSYVPMYP